MFFNKLLKEKFSDVAEEYEGVVDVHTAQKIVVIKGKGTNDTISDSSDVLVYYDVVGDSRPLIVIERISGAEITRCKVKRAVRRLNRELRGRYTVTLKRAGNNYYDVILVKTSIADALE